MVKVFHCIPANERSLRCTCLLGKHCSMLYGCCQVFTSSNSSKSSLPAVASSNKKQVSSALDRCCRTKCPTRSREEQMVSSIETPEHFDFAALQVFGELLFGWSVTRSTGWFAARWVDRGWETRHPRTTIRTIFESKKRNGSTSVKVDVDLLDKQGSSGR